MKKIHELIKNALDIFWASKKQHDTFIPGKSYIPPSGKVFDVHELAHAIEAVLDCTWTEGRFTKLFESKLEKFLGRRYALATNSGSSANLIAVSALTSFRLGDKALKAGDEVITTAACFPTTVFPIIRNRLIPVFVDCDQETLNVDVSKLEDALSKKTRGIVLAHTLGNPFNVDAILEFCKKHNLWLIEDNCDALGSLYRGKRTGSFGHIATESFYPAHHITMGEGGAVLTDDPKLERILKSLRDWGRDCYCPPGHENTCGKRFSWKLGDLPYGYDHKYIYSEIGFNLKVTDFQGAIGVAQLDKLENFIDRRRENFKILYEAFGDWNEYFILPKIEEHADPSWFGFPVLIREDAHFSRNECIEYLTNHNIGTRLIFAGNITKQPVFTNYNIEHRIAGSLEHTDYLMNNAFWIGCYPGITKEALYYVIETFERFIKGSREGPHEKAKKNIDLHSVLQ